VVLQINDVLAQETPAKAEAAAQSIKFDLSLAYEKMLSRIHPQGLKLLHWVLFARRSLSLEELRFAVAIEEGMRDLDPKRQLPFPSFIDFALGLVVVDSEERIVRFAHLTIKDYLADHSLQYFPDRHGLLARTCLTYLSFSALSTDTGRVQFQGDLYPFFVYAKSNWGHHARESEDGTTTCDMTLNWLVSKNFTQVRDHRHEVRWHNDWWISGVDYSPLHEACFFGLHSLTAKLLKSGSADINARDSDQVTPLHYAVRCHHLAVVKGLCQCPNLDVNAQDDLGYTPLQDASWDDLFDIVQVLLQHPSIEINLQDGDGRTALYNAARQGHTDIIQLLLQHPTIDINCSDNNGWTALTTAVDGGHADVVQLLLAHKDIDISASRVGEPGFWESISPGVYYSKGKQRTLPRDLRVQLGIKPSLYLAVRDGDKDTVELLLQQPDVEPNTHYGEYDMTPLHEAISGGHLNVVEALLLHPQVDVNSVNMYGRSALRCAVNEGHSDIVNALLRRSDLDINSVDKSGWSALMFTANRGYSDIVNALLQRSDIDVNQPDHTGWTPLTDAVGAGHAEIVRMLLSHKDIDITASRVWVPGFWEMPLPRRWYLKAKHMTLPGDLIARLGINPCWFTDLEIELFSGDHDSLMAEVDDKRIVDI
jgi:ankyrin repeat domain-containing protein 50